MTPGREIWRWSAAALLAGAAHAALATALVVNWKPASAMPSAAPAALMINLSTIVAPQTPKLDVAPGPDAPSSEQKEMAPPDKEVAKVEPVPLLPEKEKAVAILEMPKSDPKPMLHEPPPEKQNTDNTNKKEKRQIASRAAAVPTYEAQRAVTASAPAIGAASVSSSAIASWRGTLIAHLNRYKSYPAGAASVGTANVAFTINRSGQVMSSHLTGSSGDRALDQEAVSLPKRASPVPAPPDGVGGGSIALNVPIRFSR
jgi:protein TonB